MRIVVLALGTRGDVQPLTALSKGLADAGHSVCVATTNNFESLVLEHGLEYARISGDPAAMMQGEELQAAMGGSRNPLRVMRAIVDTIRPQFNQGIEETLAVCQGADVVIVSMLSFYLGYHVAEKLDIPCIEGYALPGRPTRAYPTVVIGIPFSLGGWFNRLSHQAMLQIAWWLLQSVTNQARKEVLGLPPISFRQVFREMDRVKFPVLHGYSPAVSPKPPDWPDWYTITGYWFLDAAEGWQPSPDLTAFLEAGPPPVYIGFGSMTHPAPDWMGQLSLQALKSTGQRGLLLSGWGALQADDLPDNVFMIDSAPHAWLFPRMQAVVHHGGAGTTAAGLRAGVPSILVPFGGDQTHWGQCVQSLGVGPKYISRRGLTAEKLTAAIQQAVTDTDMRRRASVLGEVIRAEDGVGRAVALIEYYLKRGLGFNRVS